MKSSYIALGGFILLASCSGPAQKAGEQEDRTTANLAGQNYSGEGPNERIGKSVDRADRAARDASQASHDASNKQGEAIRRQADVDATRLDEQARGVRAAAAQRAETLNSNSQAAPR